MFGLWRALRRRGVLGLNARNRGAIMGHNPRRCYPLVDDKLKTKRLALAAGIAVPELYAVLETEHDLGTLHARLAERPQFVIKPAHGSGGSGVLVVDGREGSNYLTADGRAVAPGQIAYHASNILSGIYSLGGVPDRAMVEYRVHIARIFERVSHHGVPDIRLLVYRGMPAMAMLRLPTRRSAGKANLHQGAVGVGIDLATGVTRGGVWLNRGVGAHPDFGTPLAGIAIPDWSRLLELGARCYELTGLGYLGVDVVLDPERGPLLLELNARPGLAIQIANREGLERRLAAIDALAPLPGDVAARLALLPALIAA
ncbi:MAG: alpha-L-glutamate ligase-like protein [Gammaproteobacteria bacterium]|nr:alpha-L-glutamate ligase-like protein [Gammaproteobacteria bacterium]